MESSLIIFSYEGTNNLSSYAFAMNFQTQQTSLNRIPGILYRVSQNLIEKYLLFEV